MCKSVFLLNNKLIIFVCIYVSAGRTAGPNEMIFFEDAYGYPKGNISKSIKIFFSKFEIYLFPVF